DLAYPGSRGRGRRGPALTERSATPLDARVVRAALKPLPKDAGKEARGRVLIVGGSLRYPGATLLASRAALRCGAGVVTVAAARTVVETIAGEDPDVTFFPLAGSQAGVAGRVVPAGAASVTFAERHARDWGAILVLKGPVTVVSDGKKTYVHDQPNPTLGVGGSGDALGGAVAAFLARGLVPLAAAAA